MRIRPEVRVIIDRSTSIMSHFTALRRRSSVWMTRSGRYTIEMVSRQLHAAAWRGDLSEIRKRLLAGAEVNTTPEHRLWSPLMFAASSPRAGIEVLQLLLEAGADANLVTGRTCQTPSFVAKSDHTSPEFLRSEETAILIATRAGRLDKVRTLVEAGANVAFADCNGYTALGAARTPELVRYLVGAGAPLNTASTYGESSLVDAAHWGKFATVAQLLESGSDPHPLLWTPLMMAAAIGLASEVAREILGSSTSLHDRDGSNRTPWLISLTAGSLVKARLLLDAGANFHDLGQRGRTGLMMASETGVTDLVRWLIESGANVNAADEFGDTALMEASRWGTAEAVKILIAAGADVQAFNSVDDQAIHGASNIGIIRLLADAGADVNLIAGDGQFALGRAAESGDGTLVRDLLNLGARVDNTSTGETALHIAAHEDQLEVMRLLLEFGADPNALDVDDSPPLDRAWSIPAMELLFSAGASPKLVRIWNAGYSFQSDPEILTYLRTLASFT